MVATQVVLELSQSCVGVEFARKVVAVAVAEVVKPDLVDVGCVGGLSNVGLALFD
jgi:hypothetical protein